jgi:hypothetical protein
MRAWALSIDSETPRCSDQLNESSAAHAKVVVAIAIFPKLICFIIFLQYYLLLPAPWQRQCALVAGQALRQINLSGITCS